jgi:RING-H2 zinc finger domain
MQLTKLKLYAGSEITDKNNNKNCNLCRQQLNAPPFQYLSSGNGNDINIINMDIVVGQCGDMFHKVCITEFNKTGNMSCPSCKFMWETKDTVKGLL